LSTKITRSGRLKFVATSSAYVDELVLSVENRALAVRSTVITAGVELGRRDSGEGLALLESLKDSREG
jgi:hypothetical protein